MSILIIFLLHQNPWMVKSAQDQRKSCCIMITFDLYTKHMLRSNTLVKFLCNHRRNLIHNQPVEFKGGTWQPVDCTCLFTFCLSFLGKNKVNFQPDKTFWEKIDKTFCEVMQTKSDSGVKIYPQICSLFLILQTFKESIEN